MKIIPTPITDLLVFEPKIHYDDRGYFFESFNNVQLKNQGLNFEFFQDNEAKSERGVLRGLHFQNPPFAQTKLLRVISGEIVDVAIDLRKNSNTYGKTFSLRLNDSNKLQLLVPKGFAHGYAVLSEVAIVAYKVDAPYSPENETGLPWDDPTLNINWELDLNEVKLSPKDTNFNSFMNFKTPFI